MQRYLLIFVVVLLANDGAFGSPLKQEEVALNGEENDNLVAATEEAQVNDASKDLYVIRKVVYEIGILTNTDNSSEFDNKTHEQIDVSFFDPIDNGTFVDLSNIPFPVETNVSGVALTGILPSNFGNLVFPQNGTVASLNESAIPIFPEKQVKVTKNISTVDKNHTANILSGISDVLGLSKLIAPQPQNS